MDTITLVEAQTHLASLLDRVAKGETITITRWGVPTAVLAPVGVPSDKLTHQQIVEGMRELRRRVKPDRMTVRQMVEEGRPD